MSTERTPAEIVAEAREVLKTARMGLNDLKSDDPARRIPGLRNAIVFGRAVTNVLENLRHKVQGFDDWYRPKSAALAGDPRFKRLYALRSEILKQGRTGAQRTHIISMKTDDLAPLMQFPPKGAKSFFIGDDAGGSGWIVELPDGDEEKYYVQLPDAVSYTSVVHIEVNGEDVEAIPLIESYLSAMADLISEAREVFHLAK